MKTVTEDGITSIVAQNKVIIPDQTAQAAKPQQPAGTLQGGDNSPASGVGAKSS
jgi:hypothetical protein